MSFFSFAEIHRSIGRSNCLGLLALLVALPVRAQAPDTAHREPLFTKSDAYLGAGFVLGTLALAPFDRRIASRLQDPGTQASRVLQNIATDARLVAVPGSAIIGGSLYALGKLGHWNGIADLGLHGSEAILVGNVLNTAIKWTAGRARPYVVNDTDPFNYEFLRGKRKGSDYSSFPSGHTLAAFAAASAVTDEVTRTWPKARWYVGTAMYGGATMVGLSRLYNNQHWASDVIMGAGIGTLTGIKVVRYHHLTNPGNVVDRWLLSSSIAPDGHGGVAIMVTALPGFGSGASNAP